jgi:hypothetical protein
VHFNQSEKSLYIHIGYTSRKMVEKDEDAYVMQRQKCWKMEKTAYQNACSGCGQQQQLRTFAGYNLKPLETGVPSIRL